MKADGAVYGGSAGTIILGKDIRTSSWQDKNFIGLKNTKGLDLIDGYSIWCHYDRLQDNMIKQFVKELKTPIVTLTERIGLIVGGSKAKFVGFRKGIIFSHRGKFVIPLNRYFSLEEHL